MVRLSLESPHFLLLCLAWLAKYNKDCRRNHLHLKGSPRVIIVINIVKISGRQVQSAKHSSSPSPVRSTDEPGWSLVKTGLDHTLVCVCVWVCVIHSRSFCVFVFSVLNYWLQNSWGGILSLIIWALSNYEQELYILYCLLTLTVKTGPRPL